jgi:hypothetical protein
MLCAVAMMMCMMCVCVYLLCVDMMMCMMWYYLDDDQPIFF